MWGMWAPLAPGSWQNMPFFFTHWDGPAEKHQAQPWPCNVSRAQEFRSRGQSPLGACQAQRPKKVVLQKTRGHSWGNPKTQGEIQKHAEMKVKGPGRWLWAEVVIIIQKLKYSLGG